MTASRSEWPQGNLGSRSAVGILAGANKILAGAWVVSFLPREMPRVPYEIYRGAAKGPGGYAHMYIDDVFSDVLENGAINAYDPNQPHVIAPGQTVTFHWSTISTPAPQIVLYLREPEAGKL